MSVIPRRSKVLASGRALRGKGRLDTQRFNKEPRLAPGLEPAAQGMHILVPVAVEEERHPGARGFSRLRTVEDHLAIFRDQPMWIVQRFWRNPACARDS